MNQNTSTKTNLIPENIHMAENGPCCNCKHCVRDNSGWYCSFKCRYVDPNEWHFCCNE